MENALFFNVRWGDKWTYQGKRFQGRGLGRIPVKGGNGVIEHVAGDLSIPSDIHIWDMWMRSSPFVSTFSLSGNGKSRWTFFFFFFTCIRMKFGVRSYSSVPTSTIGATRGTAAGRARPAGEKRACLLSSIPSPWLVLLPHSPRRRRAAAMRGDLRVPSANEIRRVVVVVDGLPAAAAAAFAAARAYFLRNVFKRYDASICESRTRKRGL